MYSLAKVHLPHFYIEILTPYTPSLRAAVSTVYITQAAAGWQLVPV